MVAHQLEQEALARAVAAHDEAEGRPSRRDALQVVEQRRDLVLAPNGHVRKANARHYPRAQGADQGRRNPSGNPVVVQGPHLMRSNGLSSVPRQCPRPRSRGDRIPEQ